MKVEPVTSEILNKIGAYCIRNKQSIAVAESVTAGSIQTLISTGENAEKFFHGGITVYNTAQKTRHLNIEPINAENCNAVDPEIAIFMAKEVCRLFCSSIGLASTGYAAPYPERNIRTPFAYLAIVHKGEVLFADKVVPEAQSYGLEIQKEYAERIIHILADRIKL